MFIKIYAFVFFCRGYVHIVSIMWHVQNAQVHAAYSIVRGWDRLWLGGDGRA